MIESTHFDPETAMLYASGSLDTRECTAMDAHAETCDSCARLLAQASHAVEAIEVHREMIEAPSALRLGLRRRRNEPWPSIAVAAGLVAALSLAQAFMMSNALHARDVALTSLVHSHFNHAPFVGVQSGAPSAKVLYAQDGRWLYVVVDSPSQPLHVDEITADGGVSDAGRVAASWRPQTLYSQPARRIVRVELRDDAGATIARAALVYRR